jgi:hypothetical protein
MVSDREDGLKLSWLVKCCGRSASWSSLLGEVLVDTSDEQFFFVKRGKLAKKKCPCKLCLLDFESHSRYLNNFFASWE